MSDYVDSYEILQRALINVSKELSLKAADFLSTVEEMQRLTQQMSQLQVKIQCTPQALVYDHLSKVMTSTGVYIKQLGDMFRGSFAQHLKYNLNEAGTFRDLFAHRDQSYQSFIRADKALIERKEKLFRLKDTTKWGGFRDDVQQVKFR